MTPPLIGPDQDFALWTILIALTGFGFWCERFPWGRKYSGVILLMTVSIVLANLRIIPTSAPVYDVVGGFLVPVAIPLLLFQADLKRIIRESGPTLMAFVIGSVAVVAGTLIGVSLLDLGPEEAELAGKYRCSRLGLADHHDDSGCGIPRRSCFLVGLRGHAQKSERFSIDSGSLG